MRDSDLYKRVIDRLVQQCLDGQGAIGPERVRRGIWNRNATVDRMPEQHAINEYLARTSDADRTVLAGMLADAFRGGVFASLVTLHEEGVAPFDTGYEGSPSDDFTGRIDDPDWPWPTGPLPDE